MAKKKENPTWERFAAACEKAAELKNTTPAAVALFEQAAKMATRAEAVTPFAWNTAYSAAYRLMPAGKTRDSLVETVAEFRPGAPFPRAETDDDQDDGPEPVQQGGRA